MLAQVSGLLAGHPECGRHLDLQIPSTHLESPAAQAVRLLSTFSHSSLFKLHEPFWHLYGLVIPQPVMTSQSSDDLTHPPLEHLTGETEEHPASTLASANNLFVFFPLFTSSSSPRQSRNLFAHSPFKHLIGLSDGHLSDLSLGHSSGLLTQVPSRHLTKTLIGQIVKEQSAKLFWQVPSAHLILSSAQDSTTLQ